jgi:hypothetical protein
MTVALKGTTFDKGQAYVVYLSKDWNSDVRRPNSQSCSNVPWVVR